MIDQTILETNEEWRLIVVQGQDVGQSFALGTLTVIGRDPQCEISLQDPKVSRRHAIIKASALGFVIEDQQSSNGTYINDHRLAMPTRLQAGDKVKIGDTFFQVVQHGSNQPATSLSSPAEPVTQPPVSPPTSLPPAEPFAPPPPVVPPRPASTRKQRSTWRTCLVVVLIFICLLGVVAAGGYIAVKSGRISMMQLASRLSGAGTVSITNMANGSLRTELLKLDVGNDEDGNYGGYEIEPLDIAGFGNLPLGRYQLSFSSEANQPPAATCTFIIDRGEDYEFWAVPEGVVVTLSEQTPATSEDMNVTTSSLCQR